MARLDAAEFEPMSQEGSNWEPIEGDPRARIRTLCENDQLRASLGLAEPSTVSYAFDGPSTIQILEGAMTVSVGDRTAEVGPGDVLFFRAGVTATLKITAPLRDFFVAYKRAE